MNVARMLLLVLVIENTIERFRVEDATLLSLRNQLPAAAAEHKPIAVVEVKLLNGKDSMFCCFGSNSNPIFRFGRCYKLSLVAVALCYVFFLSSLRGLNTFVRLRKSNFQFL